MTPAEATLAAGAVEVAPGVAVEATAARDAAGLLTPELLGLVSRLQRELGAERASLLAARRERQLEWDAGTLPGPVVHPAAAEVRERWQIRPLPADLRRRRVEITGPVSNRKMVLNMLSRNHEGLRADCAMLDFEDSMRPTWRNVVAGLSNLRGAADGSLELVTEAKSYRIDAQDRPLIMVRCRGLHLDEPHVVVDGAPVAGGLLELAVCAATSARTLLDAGHTPKFYIPKVEDYREARWWNSLLGALEHELGLDVGSLRVTLLIETLPATFQIEEILFELRDRVAGLNVGRWDKIFSDIKVLKEHSDRVLADRGTITMQRPWMKSYATTLIHSCHRHGAFAMGGMAAATPGRTAEVRARQTERVVADKRWEAELGHDGCWVSHPYFIGPALEAFPADDQLEIVPDRPEPAELLPAGGGPHTLEGLRTNIRVGIAYLEGWRRDLGCVAWDGLMEDLATMEISRAQTWQWLRHRVELDDGAVVTRELIGSVFAEELTRILDDPENDRDAEAFSTAAQSAQALYCERSFRPFLEG